MSESRVVGFFFSLLRYFRRVWWCRKICLRMTRDVRIVYTPLSFLRRNWRKDIQRKIDGIRACIAWVYGAWAAYFCLYRILKPVEICCKSDRVCFELNRV